MHEIVRAVDKHGVLLREIDGIIVSEEDIEQLRTEVGRWGEIDWRKFGKGSELGWDIKGEQSMKSPERWWRSMRNYMDRQGHEEVYVRA